MITELYFVRHAQPNYNNHNDLMRELSEKGMLDRGLVTTFLSNKNIDIVLSSPYKRAVDTVKHFADQYGMDIKCIEGFKERRVDSGWIDNIDEFFEMQWRDFDYKLSNGECLREVQIRNIEAMKDAIKEYSGSKIVVGSHGTALSTIINYYDNTFGYEDFLAIKNLMPWIVKFVFEDNACVSIEKIDLFAV